MQDELTYNYHLKSATQLFCGASEPSKVPIYAIHHAQSQHALTVFNPLRDCFTRAVEASANVASKKAMYYLRYGAARRLQIIFFAYRHIIFTAPPDREKPLHDDEGRELTENINSIYMHVRGVFDNYAWCLLYASEYPQVDDIKKNSVGLFNPIILNNSRLATTASALTQFKSWEKELKKRRDPVAHRIPLTIPPSIVTSEEAKEYQRLYEHFLESSRSLDFDSADIHLSKIDEIGKFFPVIVHHPDEGHDPLYPTLPTDLANLVQITNLVLSALKSGE